MKTYSVLIIGESGKYETVAKGVSGKQAGEIANGLIMKGAWMQVKDESVNGMGIEQPKTNNGVQITKKDGNWKIGTIDGIEFQAKVYEEGSGFGINESNVSKLWIKDVADYDRGWCLEPKSAKGKNLVTKLLEYFAKAENCKVED